MTRARQSSADKEYTYVFQPMATWSARSPGAGIG
jgi:hypothetical protein